MAAPVGMPIITVTGSSPPLGTRTAPAPIAVAVATNILSGTDSVHAGTHKLTSILVGTGSANGLPSSPQAASSSAGRLAPPTTPNRTVSVGPRRGSAEGPPALTRKASNGTPEQSSTASSPTGTSSAKKRAQVRRFKKTEDERNDCVQKLAKRCELACYPCGYIPGAVLRLPREILCCIPRNLSCSGMLANFFFCGITSVCLYTGGAAGRVTAECCNFGCVEKVAACCNNRFCDVRCVFGCRKDTDLCATETCEIAKGCGLSSCDSLKNCGIAVVSIVKNSAIDGACYCASCCCKEKVQSCTRGIWQDIYKKCIPVGKAPTNIGTKLALDGTVIVPTHVKIRNNLMSCCYAEMLKEGGGNNGLWDELSGANTRGESLVMDKQSAQSINTAASGAPISPSMVRTPKPQPDQPSSPPPKAHSAVVGSSQPVAFGFEGAARPSPAPMRATMVQVKASRAAAAN